MSLGEICVKTIGEVETFEWKNIEADRGSDRDLSLSRLLKLTSPCMKQCLPKRRHLFKLKKRIQDNSSKIDGSARKGRALGRRYDWALGSSSAMAVLPLRCLTRLDLTAEMAFLR